MTPTHEARLVRARETLRSTLANELAQGNFDLRDALEAAYSTALAEIADSGGLVHPSDARRLSEELQWPTEPFAPTSVGEVLEDLDVHDFDAALTEVVDDSETLAEWDDTGISFVSSGWARIDTFTLGDAVFTYGMFRDPEAGHSHIAEFAHALGDEAGRRAMFIGLIDEYLGAFWGTLDVTLGGSFPIDLLPYLREVAESYDGAPWHTERLARSLPRGQEATEEMARRLAEAVEVTVAQALDILNDLRAHPKGEPPTAEHRAAAWWLADESWQ